jgi:3-hydroxyisobutyrate dehydrogenase-like beta-hydroxyacid dehydrogenase
VVLDDDQVREVVAGEDGLLAAGRENLDIVIHSTIHLPTLYEVAERAQAAGCTLFDAGVSGHSRGAERGQLAVMVGSDEASLERCRPAFESYGGLVVRVGGLGAGMKAKVARNLIGYVQCSAVYEGLRLAEEAGVDVPALAEIVRHSEAQSQLVDFFLSRPSVRPAQPDSEWRKVADSTAPVAHKDLSAALSLARDLGIRLPVSEESERRVEAVWGIEEGERL